MKYLVTTMALLTGMAGTAYCQDSEPAAQTGPLHPGTALLDSMGIYAGTSQPANKHEQTASSASNAAAPNPSPGKRQ